MPKLVWRVKLVAELRPGVTTETEVGRIERDEQAGLAELELRLAEAKQELCPDLGDDGLRRAAYRGG